MEGNLKTRRIFKSVNTGQTELSQLLEMLFLTELISPSPILCIVSPWISDIELIDNRTGAFTNLIPNWGRKKIRFSEILLELIKKGSRIKITTRKGQKYTEQFLVNLNELLTDATLSEKLIVDFDDSEHCKGILGDNFYLSGSMNFTYNGLQMLKEQIHFSIDEQEIATAKLHLIGDNLK